jgi:hypothetical protein
MYVCFIQVYTYVNVCIIRVYTYVWESAVLNHRATNATKTVRNDNRIQFVNSRTESDIYLPSYIVKARCLPC